MQLDKPRVAQLIDELFRITDELSVMTGRPFTPDGHLVGSIGEVLAANIYGLKLMPQSTTGYDAQKGGQKIEIKATFKDRVAFRRHDTDDLASHCLVIKLRASAEFDEIYNGPIGSILQHLSSRRLQKNGQIQISLKRLAKFDALVSPAERLLRIGR